MKKNYFLLTFFLLFSIGVFAHSVFPITLTTTPTSCPGINNGTITVTPTGGTAPYQYALNGTVFQSSNIFAGLAAGVYTVSVMDASGDTGTGNITVVNGAGLTVIFSVIPTSCTGANDGSLSITVSNGTPPYTYSIDGGITQGPAGIFNNLAAGDYSISVADINGCTGTATATVPEGIFAVSAGTDTLICAGSSVQLSGSGGTVFQWSPATGLSNPGIANPVATPGSTTVYTLMVTNGACIGTDNVIISVANIVADAGIDAQICNGGSTQLSGSGGTDYSWSPAAGLSDPGIANPIAEPIATTTYNLTVSNGSGCTASDEVTITVDDLATPAITLSNPVLTFTNPDASAIYTWQQMNGSIWEDVIPAANGTSYTVTSNNNYRVKAVKGACEAYSNSLIAGRLAATNPFGIYVYPNPAINVLQLDELKLSDQWQTLEIISAAGLRVIPARNINNQTNVLINISKLNAGIFIINLTKANGESTQFRFVKE